MKLKEMISIDNWKQIGVNIVNNNLWQDILTQLYYIHGFRELRPGFETESDITTYTTSFINTNLQKIKYILSTANEEFLSQDSTMITNTQDETNAFNTDYYGGEGQTGKDTAQGDTTTTNTAINNKDKLRNFYDLTNNYLFKMLMNNLCDTFMIDESIRW